MTALLTLDQVVKRYPGRGWFGGAGVVAVDQVSFTLGRGEVLALVGESGSGKTSVAKLVTLQERLSAGDIRFDGASIRPLRGSALKAYRRRVQMIFQNPFEALDPRRRVGSAIADPLLIHGLGSAADRRTRVAEALSAVELSPAEFIDRYPADLSGGQLQRIAIARALVLEPALVVADEPVSMLDVSVRAGVMATMRALGDRFAISYLYITHDLAVARSVAQRVAVMYLGALVEAGPTETLLTRAGHPYTRLLVAAVPDHRPGERRRRIRLKGEPGSAAALPRGCRFHPRCPMASDLCRETPPPVVALGRDHWAACHYATRVADGAPLSS